MKNSAAELFEEAIGWLQATYDDRPFYVERDIVYTVQLHLWERIRGLGLPWKVVNDHGILPGSRRSLSAERLLVDPLALADRHGRPVLFSCRCDDALHR